MDEFEESIKKYFPPQTPAQRYAEAVGPMTLFGWPVIWEDGTPAKRSDFAGKDAPLLEGENN